MKKAYFILVLFIVLIGNANNLFSQSGTFEDFWLRFIKAVSSNNESAVTDMTYFANEDERDYFSFQLLFDEEAINKIKKSKSTDLKKIQRVQKEDENDPFVILDLPVEVKELFLFPVQYEEVEDDEKITYERIYAFGIIGGTYKFLGSYNSD